jgi:photosystem II stability/assembly factor-like uncharacterized protein
VSKLQRTDFWVCLFADVTNYDGSAVSFTESMNSAKNWILLVVVFITVLLVPAIGQWKPQTSGTTAQLRGVSAVSSTVAWASGSKGTYLRTTDGGATWTHGAVPGAEALDFRDVEAVSENVGYLMATAGKIFKTIDGGNHWTLQYDNTTPGIFLDSFAFWDDQHGIALGDPIKGSFVVITTSDGGASWQQVPSAAIPPAIEGEAAFAASGTCIAVQGKDNAWFATGGRAARVFRSTDRGRTWNVSRAPIISGVDSTGIFSIAFRDAKNGVIVGGDYKRPEEVNENAARTTDGGVTWKPIERSRPGGFRSSVAFIPGGTSIVAVGQAGADSSTDDGLSWERLGSEGYHSLSFARSGKSGWAVGADGRIARFEGLSPNANKKSEVRK